MTYEAANLIVTCGENASSAVPYTTHIAPDSRRCKVPGVPDRVLRVSYWTGARKPYFLFNLRLMVASLRESKELSVLVGLDAPW